MMVKMVMMMKKEVREKEVKSQRRPGTTAAISIPMAASPVCGVSIGEICGKQMLISCYG